MSYSSTSTTTRLPLRRCSVSSSVAKRPESVVSSNGDGRRPRSASISLANRPGATRSWAAVNWRTAFACNSPGRLKLPPLKSSRTTGWRFDQSQPS